MTEGDLQFRKELRDKKNELILLKKKVLVLGYNPNEILEGQMMKKEDLDLFNKRKKIRKAIAQLQGQI